MYKSLWSIAFHFYTYIHLPRATRSVPCGTKALLSYKVWQGLNRIHSSFVYIGWNNEGVGRNRNTGEKNPDRKYHIPKPKNSSPNRDSSLHSSTDAGLGKQTCSPLHHASPLTKAFDSIEHGKVPVHKDFSAPSKTTTACFYSYWNFSPCSVFHCHFLSQICIVTFSISV